MFFGDIILVIFQVLFALMTSLRSLIESLPSFRAHELAFQLRQVLSFGRIEPA
jgi:hypothetical protein